MADSRKFFRDIFKRGKKKGPENENESQGSVSREDAPSLDASRQPFPLGGYRETGIAVASNDTWTNLTSFLSLLYQNSLFAPLATVIDDLSWFIRQYENVVGVQEEHTELHIQLGGLFKDLHVQFSSGTPPKMTPNILNLCAAIGTELRQVYGTQDRNEISRLMQAEHDLDKITGCYQRIQNHLERVMLNATLNVLRIIDKQTTEAQLRQLNPSMSACYNSADAHIMKRRECTPNTREQVLIDLKAWKDKPDGQNVCWISGMAGTGKTTITNTLCATLNQNYELGASFFCTRSIPACRDVKLILPTIAYQLARFSDPFRGALVQVLDRDPDVHTKEPRTQFQRMILEPLHDVKSSLPINLVVVIDALDECDDGNGAEKILEVLLEKAPELPVKFLISSRPEYHIRDRIGRSVRKTQLTLHELDEATVKADIETYLRAELTLLSIPLTGEQLNTLVERAGVLFIYAATIIRYIAGGVNLRRLYTVLQAPDSGEEASNKYRYKEINQVYEVVLTSAFDNPDLRRLEKQRMELVLRTVICAQEPLTIEGLSGLLALTYTQVITALRPLWSILHVSGSSASDRVSILHSSLPHYMFDPQRSGRFTCKAELHHGKLAELCFQRIGQNIPQFNICSLESSYKLDQDIPDLSTRIKQAIPMDLLYACQYWAVHLCLGEKLDERATQLHAFLSGRLLLWMEVLNLTKRAKKGIWLLEEAISWLRDRSRSEDTMLLAQDAQRFATMFATSPVSQSTPHLYVSMLASWPQHSAIVYTRRATGFVRFKGIETVERQLGLLSSIPAGSNFHRISYSPDIKQLEGHDSWIRSVSFSPCGTYVISGSDDATMCIWDLQSKQLIHSPLQHAYPILFVGVSSDSEHIFSITQDGIIHVWSKQLGELEYTIGPVETEDQDNLVYDEFWPAAFLFDDKRIVCGSKSGQLYIQEGSKPTYSLTGPDRAVYSIAFSPDGQSFTSGASDGALIIWDASTGKRLFGPLIGHSGSICSIAYSPDSILLASGSWDRTIRLWSSLTGEPVGDAFQGHTRVVRSVAFSPSGNHLVSGSEDMTVRIWDVMDGQSIAIFQGHTDKVLSVAFSPNGTQIVSGSADITIRLWNMPAQRDGSSGVREERVVNAEDGVLSLEWDMDTDGWVRDAQNRLLVWVPPDLRTTLLRPQNSGLISRQGCIELEFGNTRIGDEWQTCYEPFSPASRS